MTLICLMPPDEAGLAQFPMVMGGIVPVVNVEGLQPGDLVLDGATLAKIFLGEEKSWNDPATAEALKFFAWSYAKGDKMAHELDYVPMPDKVVGDIEKMWSTEIKDAAGKSLYVASK